MSGLAQTERVSFGEEHCAVQEAWYAVHTYPRHEQKVARLLAQRGMLVFLPLLRQFHLWSDRRKLVEVPLFSCYAFVNIQCTSTRRVQVLTTPGVLRFVSFNGQPAAIPQQQIEAVRKVLSNNIPCSAHGFVKIGQRVRIRGGCLHGLEGILVRCNGRKLVVSVDVVQQSLAISLDGYDIEAA